MEHIQNSLDELTVVFKTKMSEFQKELKGSIPANSPPSNINSRFSSFLENLQLQVESLSRQYDQLEIHSRKKIVLLYGVAEEKSENVTNRASQVIVEHVGIPQVNSDSVRMIAEVTAPSASNSSIEILQSLKVLNQRV